MISFTPTDEQTMLIDTIRRYSLNDVRPAAHEADESGDLPEALVRTGWEIGILPGSIPESMGGFGEASGAVTGALAYEELAYGDLALALTVLSPALAAIPLVLDGTDEQRDQLLPLFLDETPPRVTAAFIEPGMFFAPGKPRTTATRQNGRYVLNGAKATVPLATDAERLLVYAWNEDAKQVDAFFVSANQDGLSVGVREKLMGVRALPTYPVTLDGVQVGADCRLGGEAGLQFSRLLAHSHVALAALAVGVMHAALDYAIDYAKEREQFGAAIATKQAIAFMLAECAIEVDATRLMVWEAAWKLDQGEDASKEAYLAKRYADKAVLMVADSAVQTLGGHGYIREHPVERWLRNARGFASFDGLAML
ncbi:MAG TPA: acyl-CoA dehydrogenase family protein [Aggregatilinea sp.]|uniref:acyl-CoA dehydrogenase family protein n=1 Tax=Aggregatilinea sp. TaxID=2806333 RepID=UPI002CB2EC36|nr:acyl-CoA dehydrogenase family protein [Aggregatilinea sp.]HML24096.1 acyl-CoA dehydrogenase family protein [Aggregatilinea sp.]